MSSSGINAINSGPLIIRSYLGSSSNNTYALGDNDIPISSNRVLITSTNGLVVLSDNIYVSSITVSSINGGGGGGNDVFWSSTLNSGGIVNTNTGNVRIENNLDCSSIINISSIFAPNTLSISSNQTYVTANKFEYFSTDPSTIDTFKIDLSGSNLLIYNSTISTFDATFVQNNGGGQLVLATDEPIMYINGSDNGNNHIGIGTSNPLAALHITDPNFSQVFTTSGTIVIPQGVTLVNFEMIGAGGSINSPNYTTGGAGGYIKGTINTTSLTSSGPITLTVNIGGVTNGNITTPSGASYITFSTGLLFVMAGAGGAYGANFNTTTNTFFSIQGGGGGGGAWSAVTGGFVSNGLPGDDSGPNTNPVISGGGGGGGNGVTGGTGGASGSPPTGSAGNPGGSQVASPPSNYIESLGGNGSISGSTVPAAGGNGFSGGGASGFGFFNTSPPGQSETLDTGAGGGGSSYYNSTYISIINSLNGLVYSQTPIISNNYGLAGNGGYVRISYSSGEPSLITSGAVGIGTTNPQALLDIKGTLSTLSIIDNAGSSGTSGQVVTAGTGGQVIWSTISGGGGDTFWASTLSNGGITNTNTGDVGLGSNSIVGGCVVNIVGTLGNGRAYDTLYNKPVEVLQIPGTVSSIAIPATSVPNPTVTLATLDVTSLGSFNSFTVYLKLNTGTLSTPDASAYIFQYFLNQTVNGSLDETKGCLVGYTGPLQNTQSELLPGTTLVYRSSTAISILYLNIQTQLGLTRSGCVLTAPTWTADVYCSNI